MTTYSKIVTDRRTTTKNRFVSEASKSILGLPILGLPIRSLHYRNVMYGKDVPVWELKLPITQL